MHARPSTPRVSRRKRRWPWCAALVCVAVAWCHFAAPAWAQFFPRPKAASQTATQSTKTYAPFPAAPSIAPSATLPVAPAPQAAQQSVPLPQSVPALQTPQPPPSLTPQPAASPTHFVPAPAPPVHAPQYVATRPQAFVDAYWTEPDVVGEYSLIHVVEPAFDHVQVLALLTHQEAAANEPTPAAPAPAEGPVLNPPEELPAPGSLPQPSPSDQAAGQPAAGNQANNLNDARNIGQAPEDTSLFFLRRQTVLLEPGQHQLDVGFSYSLVEDDIPVAVTNGSGEVTGVIPGRLRQRLLLFPIELRYGLAKRVQLFLNVPLGGAGTELAFKDFDDHDTQVGIGDLRFGGTFLVHQGERFRPDFVTTLDFTFPTGDESLPLITATPESRFGEGFFALNVSGLWIHTFDPCVLFYGVGYRHRFETEIEDVLVAPGEQFYYQLGVGFGVNDYLTLSASFLGFYISETYLDDNRVEGSALEPMRMRFAATISRPEPRKIPTFIGHCNVREICEPFAEIGMTDDGPSSRVGITWTY